MKITVKTLSGETFPLEVEGSDTILSIKEKVQAKKNFEVAQQKLLRKGALLADEKTVENYGIVEGDFLVVMVNVKKQAPTNPPAQQAPVQQPQVQPVQPPVQPPPQPTAQQTTQPPSSPNVGNTGAGLLAGQEYEKAIQEMESMGFSKAEAQAAMRAAFNNPERAIEYLLNGIPQTPLLPPPTQPTTQPTGGAPNPAIAGVLAQMMQSPQFQQIRALAQSNPQQFIHMMPQILSVLETQNPQWHQIIQQNPEAFLQAIFGGGGGGPRQVAINLTEEERAQIDNIVAMGFSKQDALEAFLACDRNAEYALNYLFDKQANGDLLSDHIQREENDPQNQPQPGEGEGDVGDDDEDDIYH